MVEYFHGMECFLPGMREEDAVVISRVGGGGKIFFLRGGGGKNLSGQKGGKIFVHLEKIAPPG